MKGFLGFIIVVILGIFLFKAIYVSGIDKVDGVYKYYNKNAIKDTGVSNIVTSIVLTYRGFDTLGEVSILLVSAFGVGVLSYRRRHYYKKESCFIINTAFDILFPAMILYGIYIFVHGHLTPGGGFQGGAIIATAFLYRLVISDTKWNERLSSIVEGLSGIAFIGMGAIGLFALGSFLANKGILPLGTLKRLFSAGIIPIIYIFIGLKVGFELGGILDNLKRESEK